MNGTTCRNALQAALKPHSNQIIIQARRLATRAIASAASSGSIVSNTCRIQNTNPSLKNKNRLTPSCDHLLCPRKSGAKMVAFQALILIALFRTSVAFTLFTLPSSMLERGAKQVSHVPVDLLPVNAIPGIFSATTLHASPTDAFSTQAVPMKMQVILCVSSVITLAIYHINLILKERSSKEKTWRQYQADTREEWSRHVRQTEGWLYAVQTLRNAITAQTFLATTVLSLLTLITGKLWDVLRTLARGSERRVLTVQLIAVALTMLSSAYYFLQGVRLMTHAGFMFPVSEGTKVDNIMRKSQNCQWLGLRWMYIALGPITWSLGGSRALFVTSCALLQFFRNIDRKPKGMGYEEFQGGGI